ncbi:MAG: DEAD/DEAH box helicase [Candidatus Omnitrophica bacterium]|nr:DEAD/DEAH box helicase [Candidatus Omnitrophota bacterium]
MIAPSNHGAERNCEAYIILKQPKAVSSALHCMQGCEISDCIVETAEIDEAAWQWIQEEIERKRIEKESQKPASEGRRLSKDIAPELEVEDAIECLPFASLGVSDAVLQNLNRLGFKKATPIQTLAIPPAVEGCDLIGRAQTGTGKTLAFGIPIVERLLANPGRGMRALVVAPTRELAIQIKESIEEILVDTGLKTMVVYGGDSILDQMLELREGVDILIATPGRLLDLQSRGRVRIDSAEIFVLDEADRMLDMGFMPQISDIFRCFYEHPQTMLFSATVPTELRKLTGVNLQSPVFVNTGAPDLTPLDSVSQEVFYVSPEEKEQILFDVLNQETGPIIIFVRTKRSTERLAHRLKAAGYSATRIHGDIDQSKRLQAMDAFREGKFQILVATDVASRGLDIEGIAHVINYDLPMAPEDHLHRIGRTARAGAKGKATTFVTHQERRTIRHFKKVLGQS